MKARVKMTAKEIFDFSMYNSYHCFSGVIGLFISLCAFVGAILCIGNTNVLNVVLLFIVALMFTVIQPLMIYIKSNNQAKKNKSVGGYLEYTFDDNGITVTDGNVTDNIKWEIILKISNTKNLVLLYTTRMRAFIIPKNSVEGDFKQFKDFVNTKAKNAQGKIK